MGEATSFDSEVLFGRQLVEHGLAKLEHVDECLREISRLGEIGASPIPKLGELLARKGYVSPSSYDATLRVPARTATPRSSSLGSDKEPPVPREAADAASDPGNLFGKFILVKKVGEGGFGAVFRAWQCDLGRYVALKFLHSEDEADVQRFVREAQTAARLTHRHIVPIYEVGSYDGRHYLAMELVRGQTLDKLRLEPKRAVEVMRDVAEAVEHAHQHGVIHRDLKPQNLMIGEDGRVWVMDFGLARQLRAGTTLTVAGGIVGTPAYMPPEQAEGKKCDETSDVYSLGATLYTLLTGQPPFEGTTPLEVLKKVTVQEPLPLRRLNPKVHVEVETIVQKAMEKQPWKRYPLAKGFGEDLRRHQEGQPILAKPASAIERGLKWVKRHRATSTVMGVSLASLIILGIGAMGYVVETSRARAFAEQAAVQQRAEAERARLSEANARQQADVAEARRKEAQLHLAEGLVSQADALALANRWHEAKGKYKEAYDRYQGLSLRPLAPQLGLVNASLQSPPPLLRLSGPGTIANLFQQGRLIAGRGGTNWDIGRWRVLEKWGSASFYSSLSPSGRIAVSMNGNEIGFWDTGTRRQIRSIRPHDGGVTTVVGFSPDGRLLVTTSHADRSVALWEVETGREIRRFPGVATHFFNAALSPDGALLVAGNHIHGEGGLSVWNVESGAQARSLKGHVASVLAVGFSTDGRFVLSGSADKTVRLWDLATGGERLKLEGHTHFVSAVAFSPDGKRALSASYDATTRLWDLKTGRELRQFSTEGGVLLQSGDLAFSPDGRLACADASDLLVWNLDPARDQYVFQGHTETIRSMALSSDGRLLLSGGDDKTVRLWDVATRRELRVFHGHTGPIFCVALSPDNAVGISGDTAGRILVWDIESGLQFGSLVGHKNSVLSVALSPDGRQALSGGADRVVRLWDVESRRELRSFSGHTHDVHSVRFSPDGSLVASAGAFSPQILGWDPRTGDQVLDIKGSGVGASCMAFSPDGRHLVSGNWWNGVEFWDLRESRRIWSSKGHTSLLYGVAFSPDGKLSVSGSLDNTLKIWDVESGREIRTLDGHTAGVTDVAFSPDGRFILSAGHDQVIRFWNLSILKDQEGFGPRVEQATRTLLDDPENPESLSVMGEWYANCWIWDWSAELLERALKGGARVSALALARSCWQAGRLEQAGREFQRAQEEGEISRFYARLCLRALASPGASTPAHEWVTRTPTVGGKGGTPFAVVSDTCSFLTGFRVSFGTFQGDRIVKSIQPLFRRDGVREEGRVLGRVTGTTIEMVAKPGYAVGAILAKGSDRLENLKLAYMRVRGAVLDPDDRYESTWSCGETPSPEVRLSLHDGIPVVGIHGRAGEDIDCVGLVLLGWNEERWGRVRTHTWGRWTVTSGDDLGAPASLANHSGREDVLLTHPISRQIPAVVEGEMDVPMGSPARLSFWAAAHEKGDWELRVLANGDLLLRKTITPAEDSWHRVYVDLSGYSGKRVRIRLENSANDWAWEAGYWSSIVLDSQTEAAGADIHETAGFVPIPLPAAGAPLERIPEGMEYVGLNSQGYHEYKCLKDRSVMVLVPSGDFLMGRNSGDEQPHRKVLLDAYLLDKYEVTVGQFRRFVEETGYVTEAEQIPGAEIWIGEKNAGERRDASWRNPYFAQDESHPVVCVSWSDAVAYCRWAGKRLPTEAEWEKAARGTDGRNWPWGNRWESGRANATLKLGRTTPVGTNRDGASPWGIMDLAGNASEWCADWYDPKYYQRIEGPNPRGPESGEFRVLRGGSFVDGESSLVRCARRHKRKPGDRSNPDGFRGARDVSK